MPVLLNDACGHMQPLYHAHAGAMSGMNGDDKQPLHFNPHVPSPHGLAAAPSIAPCSVAGMCIGCQTHQVAAPPMQPAAENTLPASLLLHRCARPPVVFLSELADCCCHAMAGARARAGVCTRTSCAAACSMLARMPASSFGVADAGRTGYQCANWPSALLLNRERFKQRP